MQKIISMNPFKCRMWKLHDRIDAYISEESCKAEILSFEKHGQMMPVLGRPLTGDMHHEVELIYGARRLFVARHINVPLLVEIRSMSDVEAIISMDIENRQREDVSPYERGLSYARWLRAGCFKSQEEMARALRTSASQVSRLLRLAALPAAVVHAFASPRDICETWGLHLMDALDDAARRAPTLKLARELHDAHPRPAAKDIYRMLLSATRRGRRITVRNRDEVVKDRVGAPIFRIRQQRDSLAFVIPLERVSAQRLRAIRESLYDALTEEVSCAPASKAVTTRAGSMLDATI